MKLSFITDILDGSVLCGEGLDQTNGILVLDPLNTRSTKNAFPDVADRRAVVEG